MYLHIPSVYDWSTQCELIRNIYKDNLGQEVNNLQVEFEDEALDYLNKYGSMLLDMGLSPAALKAEFSNIKGRVRL